MKILILGGNRYNLKSIEHIREEGFVTTIADKNPGAPGIKVADRGLPVDILNTKGLLQAIKARAGVRGVVAMAEVGVQPAARIAHVLGLSSISEKAARNATSKIAMRRRWQKIKKYSVNFYVLKSRADVLRALKALKKYPLIFKPDRSFGGARGVSYVRRMHEARGAYEFAKQQGLAKTDVIAEECVTGSEHSCEVLIWKGKTSVLCIGQKVKSRLPYRVDVSVQYPAELTLKQEEIVAQMCQQAVGSLGIDRGVAHVEFAYTKSGPVLFELGARCGGGHTPQIAHFVSGVDEFAEVCRIACGLNPINFYATARRGADYRFLILPPGKIKKIMIPERVKKCKNIIDVALTFKGGDTVGLLRSAIDRAGFVVATGVNREAAVKLADWACRQIVIEYENGMRAHPYQLAYFL